MIRNFLMRGVKFDELPKSNYALNYLMQIQAYINKNPHLKKEYADVFFAGHLWNPFREKPSTGTKNEIEDRFKEHFPNIYERFKYETENSKKRKEPVEKSDVDDLVIDNKEIKMEVPVEKRARILSGDEYLQKEQAVNLVGKSVTILERTVNLINSEEEK